MIVNMSSFGRLVSDIVGGVSWGYVEFWSFSGFIMLFMERISIRRCSASVFYCLLAM